jgi:hypothetical protein
MSRPSASFSLLSSSKRVDARDTRRQEALRAFARAMANATAQPCFYSLIFE